MTSKPFHPPTYNIQTPRLTLRTPVESDTTALFALLQNPSNWPHSNPEQDLTPEKLTSRIAKWSTTASSGQNAFLAFTLDDEIIGFGGYNTFEDLEASQLFPDAPRGRMTDFGIILDHRHWRRGYGSEIVCALVEYARRELGCVLFRTETGFENEGWRALMGALGLAGFEERDRASYDEELECLVWRFDEVSWEKARKGLMDEGRWPL